MGGFARSYTPAKTKAAEKAIQEALRLLKPPCFDGALAVNLTFQMVKPKSVKRDYPAVRPDIDNYVKTVLDAANGILWLDDAQICQIAATKQYGACDAVSIAVMKIST